MSNPSMTRVSERSIDRPIAFGYRRSLPQRHPALRPGGAFGFRGHGYEARGGVGEAFEEAIVDVVSRFRERRERRGV